METNKAKELLEEAIKNHVENISKIGVKYAADVYFTDAKGTVTSLIQDDFSDSLCGSITLISDDANDENGKCGFDIILQIRKDNSVDDNELEAALSDFNSDLEEFIEKLSSAEDKDAFIKEAAEKEKAEYAEKMDKFNKDMKRLQTVSICIFGVVFVIIMVGIFALVSSL